MLIRRDEHHIDKTFRKKLHGAAEETPLHLWEGVRSNIQRRKRLPVFWWWLTGAAVLTGIALFTFNFTGERSASLTQTSSASETPVAESKSTDDPLQSDLTFRAQQESRQSSTVEKTNEEIHSSNPNSSRKQEGTLTQTKPLTEREDEVALTHLEHPFNNRVKSSTVTSTVMFDEILRNYSNNVPEPIEGQHVDEVDVAPVTPASEAMIREEILGGSSLAGMSTVQMVTKPHWTSNRLMLSAWYAQANPVRRPASSESSNLIDINHRTRPHTEQTVGFGAGVRIWKGLSAWTGLEKAQFDETHQWRDSTDVNYYSTTVDYEISYPIDGSTPVITAFFDTTITQRREEVSKTEINRYTSWNVPVCLGWQQPVYKGFFVAAETGPVFRLDSQYSGKFVFSGISSPLHNNLAADDNGGSSTEYLYLNEYYRDWKMDWHAGVSIGWLSESGFGWSVGMRHRRMIGHTGSDNMVSHRIQSTGFNIGIQYRF